MYYIHAQEAARDLQYFVGAPHEDAVIAATLDGMSSSQDPFARLRCVSDWLLLWILSGRGTASCRDTFATYLQAVVITLADHQLERAFPGKEALPIFPPSELATDHGIVDFTAESAILPMALSVELFNQAIALPMEVRIGYLRAVLHHGTHT